MGWSSTSKFMWTGARLHICDVVGDLSAVMGEIGQPGWTRVIVLCM